MVLTMDTDSNSFVNDDFITDENVGNNFEKITEATTNFVDGFDSLSKIRNTLVFGAGVVVISLLGWVGYKYTQVVIAKESVAISQAIKTSEYTFIARNESAECTVWKLTNNNSYAVEYTEGHHPEIGSNVLRVAMFKEMPTADLNTICNLLKKPKP